MSAQPPSTEPASTGSGTPRLLWTGRLPTGRHRPSGGETSGTSPTGGRDHRRIPFVRQLVALASGRGAAGLLSALWLVTAARTLSPSAFGDLALILAVGAMAGIVSDLGQQTALSHEIAQLGRLDRRLIATVVRRRLLLSLAAIALTTVLYLSAATHGSIVIPLIFAGSIVGTSVYSTETAALTAVGRAQVDGANEVISRVLVLGAGWWWLHHGGGLTAAVAVYAMADMASAVVISLMIGRSPAAPSPAARVGNLSLRRTSHLAFALTAAVVYARVDTWMLGQIKGSVAAGHYAAADRVLDAVLLVPVALGALAIRQTSSLQVAHRWERTKRLAAISAAMALVPAVAVAVVAEPVMGGLFGASFRSSGSVLVILLVSAPMGAVASTCAPVSAVNTGWRFAIAVGTGLAVNVVLNLILIPMYSLTGAAEANLVSEVLLAVLLLVTVKRLTVDPGRAGASRLGRQGGVE